MCFRAGGETLPIPYEIYPDDIINFWIRLTVPAGTPIQNKQNLTIGIRGIKIHLT